MVFLLAKKGTKTFPVKEQLKTEPKGEKLLFILAVSSTVSTDQVNVSHEGLSVVVLPQSGL